MGVENKSVGDAPSIACHYCGLPTAIPHRTADPAAHFYCCSGCRFAESVTGAVGEQGRINAALMRALLAGFLSMNVMMFSMVLWSQDLGDAGAGDQRLAGLLWSLYRIVCLLFATPVMFLLFGPLLQECWQRARQGVFGTDLLLALGVAAAFAYSCVSVVRDQGDVYFDVACMILIAVTVGRWLEARGRHQATEAVLALERLLPDQAIVIREGSECIVPREQVAAGDIVRVRPGAVAPADGLLLGPACEADERILTGESLPTPKQIGDPFHAGCVALIAEIDLRATAAGSDTAVHRIAAFVRSACEKKGWHEGIADRVAGWFLPLVGILAAAAFLGPALDFRIADGILRALAVLVAACPCALGLATPMAVWSALGNAAAHQTLFRSGAALERLASVRAVCLDKTGTLTEGQRVTGVAFWPESAEPELRMLATQLARRSVHPIAAAIVEHTGGRAVDRSAGAFNEIVESPGLGLRARTPSGSVVGLGSERFLVEQGMYWASGGLRSQFTKAAAAGETIACLGADGEIRGFFTLQEQLRPDAQAALNRLRDLRLSVAVLTGDRPERAERLSRQLGVPVIGGLSPEGKLQEMERIRRQLGPVMMAGDGVNDAPALAAADVGVALEKGADISRLVADVCLLGDSLVRLPGAVLLARRTVRIIRENLFWAFAYNLVVLTFAVSGRVDPIQSAIAMVVSSLIVTTNSLRLRHDAWMEASLRPEAPAAAAAAVAGNVRLTQPATV